MKKLLGLFVPKEKQIYNSLKEIASKCKLASLELEKFFDEYNKIERNSRKSSASIFKSLKSEAEKMHRDVVLIIEASKDPKKELLISLSDHLMKSCSLINAIASRFVAMGIERMDAYTPKMAKLLVQISSELSECINHMKSYRTAMQHCKKISDLELQMDEIFEESLSELFHFFKNSLDVMKYKEIYNIFEQCADHIRNCAIIVERLEA